MEASYGKMSPSPATRISPRRDLRADNHKRQHSLESRTSLRDKEDDDLALFNEVQDRERENFLLDSNDNFDDIFSTKRRYLSDHTLGIAVPSRGQSSDLLNDEANKNDYDWLITPPETPLFPSLDDEPPPRVNHAHTGRPMNQPIPISPSPTMERGQRSSRASASPHRRSPSPRPSKPFSATRSSPPSATCHISPSRGPSPPPRSSTPTPRRIISSTTTPSTVRGASPVKSGRGNSALPKIKAWQSSIPGFSSEAPPNLRTSLFDRPASYMRGSSPASRNGRKSRSPSASRSIGSYRGSVVSSGDEDQDSLLSVPVVGRAVGISRKQTRGLSSSGPKRSLDLGRKMDRKSPPNMFRPLLSGVPSSTFHAGHASSPHYSPVSKYPSISAGSNPSANLGTSGPHDTEMSEPNQEDMTNDPFKEHDSYADDKIFVMDQPHDLSGDIDNKILRDPPGSHPCESESPSKEDIMDAAVSIMEVKSDFSDASGLPDMVVVCSICGLILNSSEVISEEDPPICHECKNSEANPTIITPVEISEPLKGKKYIEKIPNESQHPKIELMQNLTTQPTEVDELTFTSRLVIKQLQQDGCGPNSGVGAPKRAGNSFTIRSMSFTASNTSFDDISCARDSSNSKRSTFSASVSSSFDLGGFSRQTEGRICRQSSGQRSDVENYRYEMPIVHIRTDSSMSSASVHMLHVPSEDDFEEFEEKTCSNLQEREKDSACLDTEKDDVFRTQELVPEENNENLTSDFPDLTNVEALPAETEASVLEEDVGPLSSCPDRVDNSEFPNPSSFDGVSEIVNEDADATDLKSCINEIQDDEGITESIKGLDIAGPGHRVCDESGMLSEQACETKLRNLTTLEEATDVILFCSSIVHNITYEAANIAISKETPPTKVLRPTVAIFGGSDSKRRDNTRLRTMRKRSSRAQRARQKKPEMDPKPPCNADDDENSSPIIAGVGNEVDKQKPPKLESKCNCVIM